MMSKLILNVDDNDGARYAKTRILKHAGFEVTEAATGSEALDSLARCLPDLVLLDVKLPDINGLELCRMIKGNPSSSSVLVLQTSASLTGLEDRIRGLEGGADNYLAAPIESAELVANVNALLRLRQVQQELLESEERFREMAESIKDIFWMFSSEPELLYVSPAYASLWGRNPDELGQDLYSWLDGVHAEDRERAADAFARLLEGKPYDEEFRVVRPDNSVRWVRDRGFPITREQGESPRVSRITSDISAKKRAEERTLYLSQHDSLTGLPNRSTFHRGLQEAIQAARRNRTKVEVLLIDVDHFKDVNDSLGHHTGDILLKHVAARLKDCVRKTDMVARLGGDEFGIICRHLDSDSDIEQVASKLVAALSSPFVIDGHEIISGASIGVTVYPEDTDDPSQLLRNADMAMYQAKGMGRSTYQLFTADLDAALQRRRAIEDGLAKALENNEFKLHYQPQYDLRSGALCGVEALLRWQACRIPGVSSGEMITVADESGLIIPIGEWALRTACEQARSWREQGIGELRVAVNFSPKQLRYPGFIKMVRKVLRETGLPPHCLELEITERSLMENDRSNIDALRRLKKLGIYISVDDFGTGFSSLAYLKNFPVDALKIDRVFRCVHCPITPRTVPLPTPLSAWPTVWV